MLKLVFYDIESDKGRIKLAKYCESQGMERLQYSVFAGDLTANQWGKIFIWIAIHFEKYGKEETDKIYAANISKAQFKKMKCWGVKNDFAMLLNEVNTLYL